MSSTVPARRRRRRIILVAVALAALVVGVVIWRQFAGGNFHTVVEGQVYRSAQPSPGQIKDWAARYGLKTILNLRGTSDHTYPDEKAAADQAGVQIIEARCSAQDLPSALWVRQLVRVLETAPRPMLIHCNAGADRTGVASVMAAMAVGGQSYEQAKEQLSVRFGHVDIDSSHIGGLLAKYEAYCAGKGASTGGWAQFRPWAMEVYHPSYFRVEIRVPATLQAAPGQVLRVPVTIVNASDETLPAGEDQKDIRFNCFTGSSEADTPDCRFGPRVALPKADLKPGAEVSLTYELHAPAEEGQYELHFDLVEEHRTWFARQGSPVPRCRLTVTRR